MISFLLINLLTFSRVWIGLLLAHKTSLSITQLPLYTFACITDLADGYLARTLCAHSNFGKILDQAADKILCWCVCISLCKTQPYLIPASALMILRDIIISLFRFHRQVLTTRTSKIKTLLSMIGLWLIIANSNASNALLLWIGVTAFYTSTTLGWIRLLQEIR